MTINDTDKFLVNRSNSSYQVEAKNLMAELQDTDLMLVNRGGVSHKASYADVKKGFGPEHIKPAPTDWTTGAAVTSGTGTQVDPFIIAAGTAFSAGITIQSGDIGTLTGLKASDLIEWTVNAGGDRFKQDLAIVTASGTVAFDLTYRDTPPSVVDQVYNGELQIGTTFFKWDVTQYVGAIDKPAITAPADGAGETVQAISDTIVAIQQDSPKAGETTLTFATDKDLAKFKALDKVEQDSGHTLTSSAITNVVSADYVSGTSWSKAPLSGSISDIFDGSTSTSITMRMSGTDDLHFTNLPTAQTQMAFWVSYRGYPGSEPRIIFYYNNGSGETRRWNLLHKTATGTITRFQVPAPDPKWGPLVRINFDNAGSTDHGRLAAIEVDGAILQGSSTALTLTDSTDLANFRVGDVVQTGVKITASDKAKPSINTDGGSWSGTDGTSSGTLADRQALVTVTTTPATGTIASVDLVAKTMTLSVSDETPPKRWISNHGKFVKGAPTLSADAAPDVTLITFVSSAYATTPVGAAATMPHFSTDWEVYAKADTAHATLVFGATADQTNLTSWPGAQNQLTADTAYRARIRHHAAVADSPWSDDITFKTKA